MGFCRESHKSPRHAPALGFERVNLKESLAANRKRKAAKERKIRVPVLFPAWATV
jgi:hypothetical protein